MKEGFVGVVSGSRGHSRCCRLYGTQKEGHEKVYWSNNDLTDNIRSGTLTVTLRCYSFLSVPWMGRSKSCVRSPPSTCSQFISGGSCVFLE